MTLQAAAQLMRHDEHARTPTIDRDKWCAMLEAERDESRRFGHHMVQALKALIEFDGPEGCYPSIKAVALRSGVGRSTVSEAINRAAECGYLRVTSRYRMAKIRGRRMKVRDSSLYGFLMPGAAVPHKAAGLTWRTNWWARLKARRKQRRPEIGVQPGLCEPKESFFLMGAPAVPPMLQPAGNVDNYLSAYEHAANRRNNAEIALRRTNVYHADRAARGLGGVRWSG